MNYTCVNMRLPLNKNVSVGLTGVPRSCTMGLYVDDVSKIIWVTIREVFFYLQVTTSECMDLKQFNIPCAIGMCELTCLYVRLYVS